MTEKPPQGPESADGNISCVGSIYLRLWRIEQVLRETDSPAERAQWDKRIAALKHEIKLEIDEIERKYPGWLESVTPKP